MAPSVIFAAIVLLPATAWAYFGPGAGLGMVASLVAVVVAVLLVICGALIYPIMMLRKRRKNRKSSSETLDAGTGD